MTVLYKIDNTGNTRIWSIGAYDGEVVVNHGIEGGKTQTESYIAEPTNVGKANETTSEEQAEKEVKSLITKQLRLGYFRNKKAAENNVGTFKPMKLHKALDDEQNYTPKLLKLPDKVLIQTKHNGVWASISADDHTFKSRGFTAYECMGDLPLVKRLLKVLPEGITLVGELHNDAIYTETEVAGAVKRDEPNEITKNLLFTIHDVHGLNHIENYIERMLVAYDYVKDVPSVEMVNTLPIYRNSVLSITKQLISMGKEGAVVRHPKCIYEPGKRSSKVLKAKIFDTTDYEISDISLTKKSAVVFHFDGFTAQYNGTKGEQLLLYRNKRFNIGLMAAIRHDGYTKPTKAYPNGKPKFPKIIEIFAKDLKG